MATTTAEREMVQLIRNQHDEIKRLFSKVEIGQSDDRRDASSAWCGSWPCTRPPKKR